MGFIENKGQIVNQNFEKNENVLFQFVGKGLKVQLRKDGYSYEVYQAHNLPIVMPGKKTPNALSDLSKTKVYSHRIDIEFKNKSKNITVHAYNPINTKLNYVLNGTETNQISVYKKVLYKNVYNNIDFEFLIEDINQSQVKYNIILNPGANLNDIQLACLGAEEINLNKNGNIEFNTSLGKVSENIPFSYYKDETEINHPVSFQLNKNIISFKTNYDNSKTLVIDPSSNIIWGNYAGGPALDYNTAMCKDSQNNLYTTGYSFSTSNIATSGVYQATLSGSFDAYLLKYDTGGNNVWGTYFGGTDVDVSYSVFYDSNGNVYAGGDTFCTSNIASSGAHQTTYGGGIDDAMLFKFDANGQRIWSTYFGGTLHDIIGALTVDANNNVIICGHTESSNAIATAGAYQTTYGLQYDVFVAKFNSSGVLQWGTYFGDTGVDEAWGVDTDPSGDIYITGFTSSLFSISTPTAHQTTFGGGNNDCFLIKMNAAGNNLMWGTYYGSGGDENGTGVELDNTGKVFLIGNTSSTINIASPGAYQTTIGSAEDGFIASFNSNGVRLWATYFGGSDTDYIYDLFIDSSNNLFFAGQTLSPNAIATTGAYQQNIANVNNYDAYFAKFTNTGNITLATYYGGSESEGAKGIVVDPAGKVYISGETTSTVGISTPTSASTSYFGAGDAFLSKFCVEAITPVTPAGTSTVCLGDTIVLNAPLGCQSYTWSNSQTTFSIAVSHTSSIGSFTYMVTVVDGDGCSGVSDTIQVDVLDCSTTIVESNAFENIKIYPNPTENNLIISAGNSDGFITITLFDVYGKTLLHKEFKGEEQVSLQSYSEGVYFLELKQEGKTQTKKIIKQ
ncbi:MAG: T9SS type A sorting domain-containing protein [Bacteroidia bacterium]|nr:T9SS type A sorting domain-containing protein [Bacteroidia bacterium]